MPRFLDPDRCSLCGVDVDELGGTLHLHIAGGECPGAEDIATMDRLLIAFNFGSYNEPHETCRE